MTGPTVLQMAIKKQDARREEGMTAHKFGGFVPPHLKDLSEIGTIICPPQERPESSRANFATVVVGYYSDMSDGPLLFAVLKLAGKGENVQAQLLQEGRRRKLIADENQVILITDVSTNLHAEMMIVKWLCERVTDKSELNGNLEVFCSGKGVCSDCSGWMMKYGIAHAPLSGAPSPTGWTNPMTGANFKGSGENLKYMKYPKYEATISKENRNDRPYVAKEPLF